MYQKHREFQEPDDPETLIWRYRPFKRFVSILENQALFFASVENLRQTVNDPNEGIFPPANRNAFIHSGDTSNSDEASPIRESISGLFDLYSETSSAILPYLVANCWHINQGESGKMWGEYASGGNGVVIRTTFKRLTNSFDGAQKKLFYANNKEIPVHAGMVQYINRDEQWIPYELSSWGRVLHKEERKFQDERELRVAADLIPQHFDLGFNYLNDASENRIPDLLKMLKEMNGIFIPVDLSTLIETVIISPIAPLELKREVEDVLKKSNITAPVELSNLEK